MLVDSHCHLHLINLETFQANIDHLLQLAKENGVEHFLNVCVSLDDYHFLCDLSEKYTNISLSVGVHPNHDVGMEPSSDTLSKLAEHPACIAVGETGLDYYRNEVLIAQEQQRERFRVHIQTALLMSKPLIIHTRQAAKDTLAILAEEGASDIGGVIHCFSEDWAFAKRALDMNFYISFSGILTFKNATTLQEVAKKAPIDRLLIETDSPYLAPVPYRGKQNHPALVKYVALTLSELRQISFEEVARKTTANFYRCFRFDL